MKNLQYAARTLLRKPGFSLAAVLVLALGIGANSAIFTVIRAVLLAPLPYRDPDRLVRLYERNVVGENPFNVVSWPNFSDWQTDAKSFERMAAWGDWNPSLTPNDGGLPEIVPGAICNYALFSTLGAQPAMGRTFLAEDDRKEAERVVVISDALWRRRFGAKADAVGAKMRLDGQLYTVIGVMPAGFDFPNAETQEWVPVWQVLTENEKKGRGNHRLNVVARLKPGIPIEQARAELDGIARRIHATYPESVTGAGANVALLQERLVARVRPLLLVLFGAVACVLLIACVNVTNLLLARAVERRREVAVRLALGAGRWQLAKQFLTESLLLSSAGAILGLALAALGTDLLIEMAGAIPRIDTVRVNGSVLLFTALVACLTGVGVGLVPAFSSWRVGLTQAMQEGGRSATAGRGRGLFRDLMVGIEVALSLMLLAGAGLMLKSFANLLSVDPGFAAARVLTIRFSLPQDRYKTPAQVVAFYEALIGRVSGLPGVQTTGLVTVAPLAGHFSDETFTIDGRPPLPPGQFLDAVVRSADPGYFQAMGIPLKRGRVFSAEDRLESGRKSIITESMAATFFPNEDPVGKRLRLGASSVFEIVGVVGDTRQNLPSLPEPTMYFPLLRGTVNFATVMVRASGDPNLLSLPIQKEMRGLDPDLPAVTVRTMDEMMWGQTQQNRFGLTLIGLFAGLAVILSAIGLYGVLAYSTRQRTNELGIRMALGAGPSDITRLVVWQGLKPAILGVVAGLAGAAAATRLIQSILFEVKATDPTVLTGVVALLAAISAGACFVPAWRATRIDPVVALRTE